MYTSETKLRVRYAETDQMGVVYHSNFFPWFESARGELVRELGFTYADLEKTGIIMPVVEVQCKYFNPARYDDLVTIKTTLKELPAHHKIEFFQEAFNEKNELLASGRIILYFIEAATMKRSSMPAILYKKLEAFFK
jgi:acyl-CoA thioester hydrolase